MSAGIELVLSLEPLGLRACDQNFRCVNCHPVASENFSIGFAVASESEDELQMSRRIGTMPASDNGQITASLTSSNSPVSATRQSYQIVAPTDRGRFVSNGPIMY